MITTQLATLEHLITGYQLCATTEGKSTNAITIVTNCVSYFQDFLASQGISTDVTQISHHEIRAFILTCSRKGASPVIASIISRIGDFQGTL